MPTGTVACDSEWKLLCATHKSVKLWRNGKAAGSVGARAAPTAVWLGKRKEETGEMTCSESPFPHWASARKDPAWRTMNIVLDTRQLDHEFEQQAQM